MMVAYKLRLKEARQHLRDSIEIQRRATEGRWWRPLAEYPPKDSPYRTSDGMRHTFRAGRHTWTCTHDDPYFTNEEADVHAIFDTKPDRAIGIYNALLGALDFYEKVLEAKQCRDLHEEAAQRISLIRNLTFPAEYRG